VPQFVSAIQNLRLNYAAGPSYLILTDLTLLADEIPLKIEKLKYHFLSYLERYFALAFRMLLK